MIGGEGNDILNGGSGSDTLDGGLGNDQLKGGTGTDRYVVDSGAAVISDIDGKGSVVFGGRILTGGTKEEGKSYYEDKVTNTVYQWFGNTLTIARRGRAGQITVEDWSNGQLGIRLREERASKSPPDDIVSPIVLDLDGDGIETIGLGAQVHFDHDGDGFAELTGWAGSDDGLLVRDLNDNGQIDNGAELFGANTVRPGNSLAANGFAALSDLDVNGDQSISGSELATLSVWRDINQDGKVDEGELRSAVDAGIASISTGYTNSSITDSNGNQHRQIGSYVSVDGSTLSAVDVWFAADRSDSIATPLVQELPADVLALPDIEGYGTVRSLRESMVLNPVLKSLVGQFVQQQDGASRLLLMRDILWQWTGVAAYQPNSRGEYIEDARWLYMVEHLTGKPFIQALGTNEGTPNPGPSAAAEIYASSRTMVEVFYGRLMAATHLQSLYSAITPTWSVETDSFLVDYSGVIGLITASINQDRVTGTILLTDFMRSLKGQGLTTPEAVSQLISGLASLGPDIESIVWSSYIATGLGLEVVGVGDDVMTGTAQADVFFGRDGHDVLLGLSGNDELIGGNGNDVLNGGTGNDRLYGNNGSDRYYFNLGDGQDTVYNQDPIATANDIDTIQFNFAESKVQARREEENLVLNIIGTSDRVTVVGYFSANASTSAAVTRIEFSDSKVWSIDDVKGRVLIPTEQADLLSGFSGDDTISGLGGNDTIYSGIGQDQLYGGVGDDNLYGGAGQDQLRGDAGDDGLYGGDGADSLTGGGGNDVLDGGAGDDTYIFGLGDGHDVIREGLESDASGFDTVRIRSGVKAQDIQISRDRTDLILALPGHMVGTEKVYDSIRLQHVWDQDGNVPYKIERVHIEDGDVYWSFEDIKQRLLTGGDGDDLVNGYATAERLSGGAGDDTLRGFEGNDTLVGGKGDDELEGGRGIDTYLFSRGDGRDTVIVNGADEDVLYLMGGIIPAEVGYQRFGYDLKITVSPSDSVTVKDYFGDVDEQLKLNFDDGSVLQRSDVMSAMAMPTLTMEAKTYYVFQPQSAYYSTYYTDGKSEIVLGSQFNKNVLFDGLVFGNSVQKSYLVGGGQSDKLSGGLYAEGREGDDSLAFGRTMDGGAGNDSLSVSARGDTQIIFGHGYGLDKVLNWDIPSAGDPTRRVTVTMKDVSMSSVHGYLTDSGAAYLRVGDKDVLSFETLQNVYRVEFEDGVWDAAAITANFQALNTHEGLALADVNLVEAQAFEFNLPAGAFNTGNVGEPIVEYRLTGAGPHDMVPDWMTIDPKTGKVTGKSPINNDVFAYGPYTLSIQAIDRLGLVVTRPLTFNVQARHVAPVLVTPVPDVTAEPGEYVEFNVLNSLELEHGGERFFSYSGKPSWLQVTSDYDSFVFYGTPPAGTNATYNITVTVRDGQGQSTSDTFKVTVAPVTTKLTGGTGDDTLQGSFADELLTAGAGNDVLKGGRGVDTLRGGTGNDVYYIDRIEDQVEELAGEGYDKVIFDAALDTSNSDYLLTSNVEELTVINGPDRRVIGNGLGNVIRGDAANNILDGGAGIDSLYGGLGNDTYYVDDPLDKVEELENQGIDTILTTCVSYTLVNHVENLSMVSETASLVVGTGNALNNSIGAAPSGQLYGLGGDDSLWGGYHNDTLDGGQGADTMVGNEGDDVYVVDSVGDVVVEYLARLVYLEQGYDTVRSYINYELGADLERLELIGPSALQGIGNLADNVLVGNEAANVLDGRAGADGLQGGGGNDELRGGSGADTLLGGQGDDTLRGDEGNDRLDGGVGADSMAGGQGHDSYIVDDFGDVVTEVAGAGSDVVYASVNHTLAANVESLVLMAGAAAALEGRGNEQANIIAGNGYDNELHGAGGGDDVRGGDGADWIWGGEGADGIHGDAGDDVLYGGAGSDTVVGGAGNDTLYGGEFDEAGSVVDADADTLDGGANNDIYVLNDGGDAIVELADGGLDTVVWVGGADAPVTLADNIEYFQVEFFSTSENLANLSTLNLNVNGNVANNRIVGTGGNNELYGAEGNDTLIAANGDDSLAGGAGSDSLRGGAGKDTLIGGEFNEAGDYLDAETDTLVGGADNDTYVMGDVADTLVEQAGAGTDTVVFLGNVTSNITLAANVENFQTAFYISESAANWSKLNLNINGNADNNRIWGTGGNNELFGAAGNDTLLGADGDDSMTGGVGSDSLNGGAGADTLVGGEFDDLGYYIDSEADTLKGGVGNDTYVIGDMADTLIEQAGEGTDTVVFLGSAASIVTLAANVENFQTTFYASEAAANLSTLNLNVNGNAGNNRIWGTAGNNVLNGGAGDDTIRGAKGDDDLRGGLGNDSLVGGSGADIYRFARGDGADTITDTDATSGVNDRLIFDAGIDASQLWFKQSGSDLEVLVIGTSDKIKVSNWYGGASNRVETFTVQGTNKSLTAANVDNLVQAMANFAVPAAGQTTLPANYQSTLNPTIAANWV